jgi:hypothetical protein
MEAILQHRVKVDGFNGRAPPHEVAQRSLAAVALLVRHGAHVEERHVRLFSFAGARGDPARTGGYRWD